MSHSTLNPCGPTFSCNDCLTDLKLFEASTTTPRPTRVVKQYLTSCYHVLCYNCRVKSPQKCSYCNKKCEFMEINNKMPKHFQWYFGPASIARDHLINVMQFQRQQAVLSIARKNARAKYLRTKYNEQLRVMHQTEAEYRDAVQTHRKIKIIFNKLCEEKRRKERERRKSIERRHNQHRRDQRRSTSIDHW